MGWSLHHAVGLIHHSPMFSYKGYTLVFSNSGKFAALLDMQGRVCHRWDYHEGLTYATLLPNGNLLGRTPLPPTFDETRGLGGSGGSIVELNWDGVKVWEMQDPWMHHDYERTLTGNTFYLLWEPMPADLSAQVRGGVRSPEDPIHMLGDTIREIDVDCETVREWRIWEKLNVEDEVDLPARRPPRVDSRQLDRPDEGRRLPAQLPPHQQRRDRLTRDRRHQVEMGRRAGQPPAPRDAARRPATS